MSNEAERPANTIADENARAEAIARARAKTEAEAGELERKARRRARKGKIAQIVIAVFFVLMFLQRQFGDGGWFQ